MHYEKGKEEPKPSSTWDHGRKQNEQGRGAERREKGGSLQQKVSASLSRPGLIKSYEWRPEESFKEKIRPNGT